jgi:hypothetical protein
MSDQVIAREACYSVYGRGLCRSGFCGRFYYYFRVGHQSCNCRRKKAGEYEFIFRNNGYSYVGQDYTNERSGNVVGNGLFVRKKLVNNCDRKVASWELVHPNLGEEIKKIPTARPTKNPTNPPTENPTNLPTKIPTNPPTKNPTNQPTLFPTNQPTLFPTNQPTLFPTNQPTLFPTNQPTLFPTNQPTKIPTNQPTLFPTNPPTVNPTNPPSEDPTNPPTENPTNPPTENPTNLPSKNPTNPPTKNPTNPPTMNPTNQVTLRPTGVPSRIPCKDEFSWCVYPTICDTDDLRQYCPFSCDDCLTASPTSMPTLSPTDDCAAREDLLEGVIDHILTQYLKSEDDE